MGRLIQRKILIRKKLNEGLKQTARRIKQKKLNEKIIQRKEIWTRIQRSKYYPIFQSYYDGIIKPISFRGRSFWELDSFDKAVKKLKAAVLGKLFDDLPDLPESFYKLIGEKFSIDDILGAIEVHKRAFGKQYYPKQKSILKVHLDDFILNEFSNSEMTKSFLAYWTLNDLKIIADRIPSPNTSILDKLMKQYKEDISIQKQNKILRNLDLVCEDIGKVNTYISIDFGTFLTEFLNKQGLYPSDMVDFDFRKKIVKEYRERFGV